MKAKKAFQTFINTLSDEDNAIVQQYLKGYWDMFKPETGFDGRFFGWMAFALLFLAFIIFVALLGGRKLAALTAAAKPAEVELSEETE